MYPTGALAESGPPAFPQRRAAAGAEAVTRAAAISACAVLALLAAAAFPILDRSLNPTAAKPGLVSFVGVGATVLAVTMLLFFVGLRGVLPRGAVFLSAAVGYSALVIAVKFGLGPIALYAANDVNNGFLLLNEPLPYAGLAAIAAFLYGGAFFVLYLVYRSRLGPKIGRLPVAAGAVQLLIAMFVLAIVGVVTLFGLGGFIEYSFTVLLSAVGLLIALALLGAILLAGKAFSEASDQVVATRNVSALAAFAWIGLAFIAAYHVLWFVFALVLISLWPLRPYSAK